MGRELKILAKEGLYLAWEFSVYVILVLLLPLVLAAALACVAVDFGRNKIGRWVGGR